MLPIRHARLDELPKLAAVERSAASLFREAGLAWIAEGGATELAAMCRDGMVWVAVDATDEPVAFLAGQALDGHCHIAEVSVARTHQRQGIGGALIAAAENHAATRGFRNLTLTTYRDLPRNGPFSREYTVFTIGA